MASLGVGLELTKIASLSERAPSYISRCLPASKPTGPGPLCRWIVCINRKEDDNLHAIVSQYEALLSESGHPNRHRWARFPGVVYERRTDLNIRDYQHSRYPASLLCSQMSYILACNLQSPHRTMSAFPLHLLLRPRRLVAILFLFVFIELCLLPSDHRFRLYYRHKYYSLVEPHLPAHQLISEKSPFAVDLEHDVGLILKTGFGTKQRPVAHLQAIADGANFSDIIVIGDYSSEQGGSFSYHGAPLPVYDAVAMNIEAATRGLTLEGPTILAEPSDRLLDYQKIHAAIDAQDADLADKLSREFGWKLDAFKVIHT